MLKLQTTNGSFCKKHGLLRIEAAHVYLLNVGMVADVILAIAVIAIAFGAITELQIRIGYIRAATNRAFMMIRRFHLCGAGLEGTGIGERNGAGSTIGLLGSIILFLAEQAGEIGAPGHREHIINVRAEEQEVIGQSNQREQIEGEIKIREGIDNHRIGRNAQVEQREDPCPDRNDEEQQEMGIRVQGGIAQEQAQIQIEGIGITTK